MARVKTPSPRRLRAKKRLADRRAKKREKAAANTTAIVKTEQVRPIIYQARRPRELRPEEIELLKNTVAKGCSNDEFAMFLWVCRKHKLDPLTRQIYAVRRWLRNHHEEEKTGQDGGKFMVKVGGYQMTIQMGIDGYRSLAGRDHKDFGGCDEPEFTWFEDKRTTPAGKLIPEKATIRMWKKGLEHPVVGTAYWEEYAPASVSGEDTAGFWNRMPKHMLSKCAEALAIRKGYPELSDIYTDVEMSQADQDRTEEGRLIVENDGRTPSGAPAGVRGVNTWREQQPAIDAAVEKEQAIASMKAKGIWCEQHQCPVSTNHLKECEASRKALEAAKTSKGEKSVAGEGVPTSTSSSSTASHTTTTNPKAAGASATGGGSVQSSSPAAFLGRIEIDWTDKDSPIVRGDIANLLPTIQKHCKATWVGDWWHVQPQDVQTLKEMCTAYSYEFVEVFPAEKLPPKTQRGADKLPPPKKKAEKEPKQLTVIKGTLERVQSGMTSSNSPTRTVKIGNVWYSSYVNTIFEYLDKGLGKESELFIDARKNIVGIKRIGARSFLEDGRTPIVDRDEPRGGNLFDK